MNYPKVSIIIVTFNSATYLNSCLKSVLNSSYPEKEIIIIDNNSTDETRIIVKKFGDKIKKYNTGKNLGYAGGNNFGIEKSSGKYLFLLNPDTLVEKGFLEPLVSEIEKNKKIAACQPLIRLMNNKKKINLTGKVTHYLGFDWVDNYLKEIPPEKREIYSFSGCGILLRRDLLDKIGVFDETYFMYYEDTDLSWRIRLVGYKIVFVPESIIFHDYKYIPQENYQSLKNKIYYNERNRLLTLLKNYSFRTLLIILPILIFIELSIIIFSFFNGWFRKKFLGYCSIINLRNEIFKKRRFIQKIRLLSDKQIITNFTDKLSFGMFNRSEVKILINPFLSIYWKLVKNLI